MKDIFKPSCFLKESLFDWTLHQLQVSVCPSVCPSVPTLSTLSFLIQFGLQIYLWKPYAKADVLRPLGAKWDER